MRFSQTRNPTVRFRGVFRYFSKYYGAVCCCDKSYGVVRCGSPSNGFCYSAGPLRLLRKENRIIPCLPYGAPYEQTVQNRCFVRFSIFLVAPTKRLFLHGAQYKLTVQYRGFVRLSRFSSGRERNRCSYTVSLRCTAFENRTNPRVRTIFGRFLTSKQSHQQQQQ